MDRQKILKQLECGDHILSNGIRLRKLQEDDAEDMFEYTSNEDCCIYLKWGPHTQLEQARQFILKRLIHKETITDLLWGIELLKEDKLIGVVRVYHIDFDRRQAEISYIINPFYAGNGYATTAVKYVISLCLKELSLDKIIAFYVDKNTKSEKLLRRCGAIDDKEWDEKAVIKNKNYSVRRCFIFHRG